jgi:hypothetical protein
MLRYYCYESGHTGLSMILADKADFFQEMTNRAIVHFVVLKVILLIINMSIKTAHASGFAGFISIVTVRKSVYYRIA